MLRFTISRTAIRSQLRPQLLLQTRGFSTRRPLLDWADVEPSRHHGPDGRFGHPRERSAFAIIPMMLLPLMPFVCLGLGIWQVKRLNWKVNLIEDLQDKLQRAPMMLPRNVNLVELPNFEYRRVQLSGVWDHAHSILLGPKTRENLKGYNLITPLVRFDGGSTVLINRGFVSEDTVKKNPGVLSKDTSTVHVEGLLRTSQLRNSFTPDNNPEKGEWYWADVNAMANYAGGEEQGVQPVYIESIFDGNPAEASQLLAHGEPIGRSTDIELRNMHLTYAITWFTLGIATTALGVKMIRQRRSRINAYLRERGFTPDLKRIKPTSESETSS